MKTRALRGMGQQKYTELMYDLVMQRGEVYMIDPKGTFEEEWKRLQEILAQKKKPNLS
ncbi:MULTISPECIES: hypothetical protein [Bacillus cereus group]|jgi:hypothetical protein|uniref:Uncharacterized protein n=1 Tax=Bacillus cereus TaxID=1396 RepID=A0AAW5L4V2_BACCE|nr:MULTISPECIES: hypothetical protein [Bacillus cereus group]MCQ6287865.1 hypothetical protein [Bacillus cereus]MCQ6315962.1 hypothetical protein [Bacillus cereus]MCQ6327838.1 hypothetical protein [Bacillus cereus]MCQ6339930.1 hypothetical protein [Bacillus cereus]MCQ6384916.1 hypothetical protein [Bacillus cereus]